MRFDCNEIADIMSEAVSAYPLPNSTPGRSCPPLTPVSATAMSAAGARSAAPPISHGTFCATRFSTF
jgi:hypothetical protein